MGSAARQLQQEQWKDAIPQEQKALQYLLRAEATFRQIEVAFGARGGGGGGGGGAARDLAALFDLELDTEKNQYETQQQASSTAEQKAKEIDDALKKLDELAKREENLAQQQRNGAQTAEEKWQQEMLRRDAEELQKKMEQQLAQSGQQGQQGSQGGSASGQSSGQSGRSGQSGSQGKPQQSADSRQQAAQQALDRLRQANDDMRRASSPADARRAAERLREATDLLGGVEQQDAAGRLKSMAQTADQLTAEQKQQADNVRKLLADQNAARAAGKPQKFPTAQEIDKMVNDRQKVSDELSRLTQQMRTAARELASTQPAASNKLRGALDGLDENDLGTRMQRSSDWLRGGQFSDQAEAALTNDLQKLGQQVGDAARALGRAQQTSKDADLNRAMDDLSRLRDQLAGLGRDSNSQANAGRGNPRGQGQPGQGQSGRGGQQGQLGRDGQGGQTGQGGNANGVGNRQAGPVGNPGGGAGNRNGSNYGGYDTGNTRITGHAVAPQQGPNPADTQRQIDQGLDLLNQVRAAVGDTPEAREQLKALIEEMRNLDPKRFPGNPALVEQMHQQLVSEVDAIELQLRRQLDQNRGGTIRNADPTKVPAGYRDSVAEYYRKLSGSSH